jgi:hypothetical protein
VGSRAMFTAAVAMSLIAASVFSSPTEAFGAPGPSLQQAASDEFAAADGSPEQWHRLNPDRSNPAPEHERLRCHLRGEPEPADTGSQVAVAWVCRYDKLPEPELSLSWNRTRGSFLGLNVTATWVCPSWLPSNFCARVTRVLEGTFVYTPAAGEPFAVREDLVLVRSAPTDKLVVIWIDAGFACRWFPSFDAAVAANPFPLPFDGVHWPSNDCLFAPR